MPCYSVDELPDYFQPIIRRISRFLERSVVVDDYDDQWVRFHVPALVDHAVITQLEDNNDVILLGDEQKSFQILCPWSAAGPKGLWLHYLEDDVARGEYRAGCWYF